MARILIVEDEAEIAFALESDLRLEGYDVELAKDALTFVVPPNVKVLDASGLLGVKP